MKTITLISSFALALVCVGCSGSSEATPAEEAKMKQAMDGKNFDPSTMSPQAKAMMEQMNKKVGPGGSAPAMTPPPAAGK